MRAVCDLQRARGTGRGRNSRGESIRLMSVNLNPKGRRLPTKLVSPARRWARGPPNANANARCIALQCERQKDRPGPRLQAPGFKLQLGLPINLLLGRVETTLLAYQGAVIRQAGAVSGI